MWIVINGDPMNGLTFYGPFQDNDAALNWAEDNVDVCGVDWWLTRLQDPAHFEQAAA